MSSVLGGYLRKRVAGQIFGLLLALTGLMQLLELLEVTNEVLDRNLGITGVLHYAVLRIPSELVVALPLAGLLGSMAAFHSMARSREVTALRSAGVGLSRLLWYLLPVPILFALLHVALMQTLVPRAESRLKSWWDSTIALEEQPANPQWVRTSRGVLLFERASADGERLLDLRIYQRGADGLLASRARAESAAWQGGAWQLAGIHELSVEDGRHEQEPARTWQSNLQPNDVVQLDSADPHLSSFDIADVIGGDRVGTRPRSFYQTILLQSFTAPFTVFIMMLLAMPAAMMAERGGGGGRLLLALVLGLGFLLVDGMLSAFGTSGRIPPMQAVVIAPLVFALLGFLQLRSSEKA